jgi:hypothetical protein
MLLSLWVRSKREAFLFLLFYWAAGLMLKSLGYTQLLSDSARMTEVRGLFTDMDSPYFLLLAAIALLFLLLPFLYTLFLPVRYLPRNCAKQGEYIVDYRSDVMHFHVGQRKRSFPKTLSVLINAVLIVVLLGGVVLNLFMMVADDAENGGVSSVLNVIPYLNESDKTEAIEKGEFAFFPGSGRELPRSEGGYRSGAGGGRNQRKTGGTYFGQHLHRIRDESLTSAEEADRSSILGVLLGRSSWLGQLAVFSFSLEGRTLLLLLPIGLMRSSARSNGGPER